MEKQIEINGFLVVSDETNALVIDVHYLNPDLYAGYNPSGISAYPVNNGAYGEAQYKRRMADFWKALQSFAQKQHDYFQKEIEKITNEKAN